MIDSLSFVFPMYNEIGNIERTIAEATAVGRQITPDLEIVVVDDASTDGSGELADRLARQNSALRVIHHPVNRQLGGTLRTGFAAATRSWVLYIDSDLPIRMHDALAAVPLTDAADMVIGYRLNRCEGLKRELMSWCYNRLIGLLFGLRVRDVNFAFKLFRRELLRQGDGRLPVQLTSEGSFIDAELLLEARRVGCSMAEVGLHYCPREAGVSTLARPIVVARLLADLARYARRRGLAAVSVTAREEATRRRGLRSGSPIVTIARSSDPQTREENSAGAGGGG